jgi:hypothetical protein
VNADGGAHVSGCADRVGAVADGAASISGGADGVGAVVDGAARISGGADGVGAVADGGMAHARAHAFTAADVASGFACLPDHSPPAYGSL